MKKPYRRPLTPHGFPGVDPGLLLMMQAFREQNTSLTFAEFVGVYEDLQVTMVDKIKKAEEEKKKAIDEAIKKKEEEAMKKATEPKKFTFGETILLILISYPILTIGFKLIGAKIPGL